MTNENREPAGTSNEAREQRYLAQNGTDRLTPKQRRRLLHKRAKQGELSWMTPSTEE